MKGYMYILECIDGSYYTGSTKNLELRLEQHKDGKGANHTKKKLPIKLVYFEEFDRIDEAFYREKQIQGWSRKKKEALITNNADKLPDLSLAYRDLASSTSANGLRISTVNKTVPEVLEGKAEKDFIQHLDQTHKQLKNKK